MPVRLGRWPRLLPVIATTAAVAGLGLPPGTAAASSHRVPANHWRVVARSDSALNTIVAPSATSAWAMGTKAGAHNAALPAGVHWNGRSWSAAAFPEAVASGIGCSGASSPRNVWAFAGASIFGGSASYAGALRLSGGKWVVDHAFTPPGLVSGCSVFSPTDAWVYGLTHVAPGVGTWRLKGRTWKPVHTPNFYLVTASAVSASDIWAIAAGPTGLDNVVAHWNGRAWRRNKALDAVLPPPSATVTPTITAINAVSAGNVWLSAEVDRQAGPAAGVSHLVLHLSGGIWHKVGPANVGYYLPGAVSDGHGGWWAIGPPAPLPPAAPAAPLPARPYLLHETRGHWLPVALPVVPGYVLQVIGLAHVPGSGAMLAIGELYNGLAGLHSAVLAYGNLK